MRTLTVPYSTTPEGEQTLAWLRRVQSAAIRQVYAQGVKDPETGKAPTETEQRASVNARWQSSGVGSMVLQNAVRAGRALRTARPEGDLVFGGKQNLARRAKGLISKDEWKALRLRPLELQGNINKGGNYHIVWPDGDLDGPVSALTLRFPWKAAGSRPTETRIPLRLYLGTLSRRQQALLADLFRCARGNDLTLSLRIDADRIAFTYDPLDLRALPPGQSLIEARAAAVAAGQAKRKGRARTTRFKPTPVAAYPGGRPLHPDLKTPQAFHAQRKIGIDLNPEWIGITVLEHDPGRGAHDNLAAFDILDYRLLRWDMDHFDLRTREGLSQAISIATQRIVSLARAWHVGEIVLEDKLGQLQTRNRGKTTNRKNNTWARSKFRIPLEHRASLAGIVVHSVNAAYSTTIGNVGFGAVWEAQHPDRPTGLPDACAAAAEIARRAFVPDDVLRAARDHDRRARMELATQTASPEQASAATGVTSTSRPNANTAVVAAFVPIKTPWRKRPSQHDRKHQDRTRQTNRSALMQAWLPKFDPRLLQCDRRKETAAGSSDWVDAHGKLKTVEGFRRPHTSGFTPPASRSVDARPALDGHEVVALGYTTRPGWWMRPRAMIDRRRSGQGPATSRSVNRP